MGPCVEIERRVVVRLKGRAGLAWRVGAEDREMMV